MNRIAQLTTLLSLGCAGDFNVAKPGDDTDASVAPFVPDLADTGADDLSETDPDTGAAPVDEAPILVDTDDTDVPIDTSPTLPPVFPPWGHTGDTGDSDDTGLPPGLDTALPVDTGGPLIPGPGPGAQCSPGTAAHIGARTFASVQAALQASQPNDTVVVCPGTWRVNWQMSHNGPLTVIANDLDPTTTRLDGGLRGSILEIPGSAAVRVEGLGFVRGVSSYGGGAIEAGSVADLEVVGCRFTSNYADYEGGAISAYHGTTTTPNPIRIRDSIFRDNRAGYEGGAIDLGIHFFEQRALLERVRFRDNRADYAAGAVELNGSSGTVRISDAEFVDNSAGYAGGALEAYGNAAPHTFTVRLTDSVFLRNRSGYSGVIIADHTRVEFSDVDLGAGPDDNRPVDVEGCSGRYGAASTFVLDAANGLFCQ